MKKNIFVLFIVVILLSSFIVSAVIETLPTQKQNQCVNLPQFCATCSYVTLASVILPNSTALIINQNMTQNGATFNYTFCDTGLIGTYIVNTVPNGNVSAPYDFDISSSGNDKTNTGEGLSILGSLGIIVVASIFFLILFFSTTNQIMKSTFVGLSGVLMLAAVLFGMTMASQTLGGFDKLISGYYAFYWLVGIIAFAIMFSVIIAAFVKSLKDMKIRSGQLDVD